MKSVVHRKTTASIALTFMALLLTSFVAPVYANPQPIPADQKLVFNFQYIAKPVGTADNVKCGDGHRVFTEVGATGHLRWHLAAGGINIVDCLTESIDGTWAQINVDGTFGVLKYWVYVRLLSHQDGNLRICQNTVTDELGDHLCLLGDITLTKDKTFTLVRTLWDGIFEDIVWHLDPNDNFKHADIRVYASK